MTPDKKIFLSFDFYGAGNIGDDLMLKGFINGMGSGNYEFYCFIPRNNSHQVKRFEGINFISAEEKENISAGCKIWIGAGDTPVQVKSGDWFINKLLNDSSQKKNNNFKYFFIGIGAEKEAENRKETFSKILNEVDHIWTRDEMTTEMLEKKMSIPSVKISTSSDLANIFLKEAFENEEENGQRKYDIGLCYYDESAEDNNVLSIKKFLKKNFKNKNVLMFSNDVSMKGNFEFAIYGKMFGKFERKFNRYIEFYAPDYLNEPDIKNLISHYSECSIVMSSRYHSLLTAAWAGCKVISLERSSKVTSLARDLGIHEVKKPYTPEKLKESLSFAKRVDKNTLIEFYNISMNGIDDLKNRIKS